MITKGAFKIYVPAKYLLTRIQRIQNRATTKAEGSVDKGDIVKQGNKAKFQAKFHMSAYFEISHVSGG